MIDEIDQLCGRELREFSLKVEVGSKAYTSQPFVIAALGSGKIVRRRYLTEKVNMNLEKSVSSQRPTFSDQVSSNPMPSMENERINQDAQ